MTRRVPLAVLMFAVVVALTGCGGSKRGASAPSRATPPLSRKQSRPSRENLQLPDHARTSTGPLSRDKGLLHNSAPGVGCSLARPSFSDSLSSSPITVYACPIQG